MKTWAERFGMFFLIGFAALVVALAYSTIGIGRLFADNPFLFALRAFGGGLMATGLSLWIMLRREQAGKTGLNTLFGFLLVVAVLLLVLAVLFSNSALSHTAALAGLGFAGTALVLGLIVDIFNPAFPEPIATSWPSQTILTRFAKTEDEAHEHGDDHTDDLTRIEGIGPKISEILAEVGIVSFERLATTDASDIHDILKNAGFKAPFDPTTWPMQAEMADDEKWEMLEAFQEGLKAGRTA